MLLPSLGISVANIALPSLRIAFDASSQEAQWVVIAYLVVVTSSLVTAGRLGDLFGRKPLLLAGIAIFSLASLGAVLAHTIWVVVLARAVQGLGAAMMMSLTVAALSDAVTVERTGTAMGLLGTVSAIGTAAGPSLGGLLLGMFGWPSIFVLMAIAGLLAALFVGTQLPAVATLHRRPAFDLPGALTLMLTVAAFALATTLGPLTFVNAVLGGLAVLGVAAFVRIERRAAAPLITGASAMGTLFTLGSGGTGMAGGSGLQAVFAAASLFVVVALGLSAWANRVEATSNGNLPGEAPASGRVSDPLMVTARAKVVRGGGD